MAPSGTSSDSWVYPRACGGTIGGLIAAMIQMGLSPRVRGNPSQLRTSPVSGRSIPARAGEPQMPTRNDWWRRVYPRACGGTTTGTLDAVACIGLSPRVRGNPPVRRHSDAPRRSIPARAGEPARLAVAAMPGAVYPRACGGTIASESKTPLGKGLSPRVRGNPLQLNDVEHGKGSIPARAGEPAGRAAVPLDVEVYPRACGGTFGLLTITAAFEGLSPRVRGNRPARTWSAASHRSIPARAGEPRCPASIHGQSTVYPRACGGTAAKQAIKWESDGLSPRVRGNLNCRVATSIVAGSIPARAGEPSGRPTTNPACRVYPRACGGTVFVNIAALDMFGLSPRVRGNRYGADSGADSAGSIPARAGEPAQPAKHVSEQSVYPRACGGTPNQCADGSQAQGLSPRVRGNPARWIARYGLEGSIPARAGEPPCRASTVARKAVYPRACGGTVEAAVKTRSQGGLSPRVRGNHDADRGLVMTIRSIPARAGEPLCS